MSKWKVPPVRRKKQPVSYYRLYNNIAEFDFNTYFPTYKAAKIYFDSLANEGITFQSFGNSYTICVLTTALVRCTFYYPDKGLLAVNHNVENQIISQLVYDRAEKHRLFRNKAIALCRLAYHLDKKRRPNDQFLVAAPMDSPWYNSVSVPVKMKEFNLPLKATIAKLKLMGYEIINPETFDHTFKTFG